MSKDKDAEKTPLKARVFGLLLSLLTRFIFKSSRKVYVGAEHIQKLMDDQQNFILVSWHNRNILAVFGYLSQAKEGRRFAPLASASKDGTIATICMEHLGVECIRGSSSRGGTQALRAMIKRARAGDDLGITPDGPRGPKYELQKGVITTAKMTGLPLLPVAYFAKNKKILNSWDGMIVPRPFTKLQYVYGEPIHIPRKASEEELEEWRVKVEAALMDCVHRSEDLSQL